jgi:hypothetical protein
MYPVRKQRDGIGRSATVRIATLELYFVAVTCAAFALLPSGVIAAPPDHESVTHVLSTPTLDIWHIEQPTVTWYWKDYPAIRLQPDNIVVITATGCVQTSGSGKTWKAYVHPLGENSDRLYHGLVYIPGGTLGLVRLASVVGRPILVRASEFRDTTLSLCLGYEDDDFHDNGYDRPDPGSYDQCMGPAGAPAKVTVLVYHGPHDKTPEDAAPPFDLVSKSVDVNGLPLNPTWAGSGGGLPHVGDCAALATSTRTSQYPAIDAHDSYGPYCRGTIDGHLNWGVAAYQGTLDYEGYAGVILGVPVTDHDVNITLLRPDKAGATDGNPQGLHMEFDARQTIDHFQTSWWKQLRDAIYGRPNNAGVSLDPRDMLRECYAVCIGLVGLDCVHDGKSELHPVLAMAIRTSVGPTEKWAYFMNTLGDEGSCSLLEHALPGRRMGWTIPWPDGADSVAITNDGAFANGPGIKGPQIVVARGRAIWVTLSTAPTQARLRAHGEITCDWFSNGKRVVRPSEVAVAVKAPAVEPDTSEVASLRSFWETGTSANRDSVTRFLSAPSRNDKSGLDKTPIAGFAISYVR